MDGDKTSKCRQMRRWAQEALVHILRPASTGGHPGEPRSSRAAKLNSRCTKLLLIEVCQRMDGPGTVRQTATPLVHRDPSSPVHVCEAPSMCVCMHA